MATVVIVALSPPIVGFLAWFEAKLFRDQGSRLVGCDVMERDAGVASSSGEADEGEEPCSTSSLMD